MTALVPPDPSASARAGRRALALLQHVQRMPEIATAAEADQAVGMIRQLQTEHDAMIAERDAVAKPMRKIANAVSKRWKPAIDAYAGAIDTLRRAHAEFMRSRTVTAQIALSGDVDEEQIENVVQIMAPTDPGAHQRTTWGAEVTDLRALLRYALESPDPSRFVQANITALNADARRLHDKLEIPGVRAVATTKTTVSKK